MRKIEQVQVLPNEHEAFFELSSGKVICGFGRTKEFAYINLNQLLLDFAKEELKPYKDFSREELLDVIEVQEILIYINLNQ